jgi:phenylpropionate dioxygenase-like ring-hydroxylating dioxygenase large terminal subunit
MATLHHHSQLHVSFKALLKQLKALASTPLSYATALPSALYTSAEIAAHESKKIFSVEWLCAGRADELPKAGDYMSFDLGHQPIIIIKKADDHIVAHANVCRHRMMKLVEGRGNVKKLTCPYHAWTYDLDGRLIGAAHMEHTQCFKKTNIQLSPIRCETYAGWIYVSLNPNSTPVAERLADLDSYIAPYQMQHYQTIFTEDHLWHTNWKCLTENFMEGYHLPVAHKATVGEHFLVGDTKFADHGPFDNFTIQWFKKTCAAPLGAAHPKNTRLKGDWRSTSVMPTVFPCHMYVLAPDHLWYLSLQPEGVGKTRIRYGAAIAPEVLASQSNSTQYIADIKGFLDTVQSEDKFVVESIFKGAQSPLSSPGPLSWLERENHEFTQYLNRQLR